MRMIKRLSWMRLLFRIREGVVWFSNIEGFEVNKNGFECMNFCVCGGFDFMLVVLKFLFEIWRNFFFEWNFYRLVN